MKRILIMGLPGSGKTTLAHTLRIALESLGKKIIWLNAHKVRKEYNDWDFSHEGRIRQANRMFEMSTRIDCDYVISDFVCPLPIMREIYRADFTVWLDTISEGRFEDTNKVFLSPEHYDFRVTEQDSQKWATIIAAHLLKE